MSAHEFTIPVAELDAGGKHYRFVIPMKWVRGILEDHEATAGEKDGALEVRASKSGHDVVVHGTFDAEVRVPCARCTDPVIIPIHADLSVLYVPAAKVKSRSTNDDGVELTDEEADTLPFTGDDLNLDDLVRDELLLEIPMIPLCSEDCPGISPAPGGAGAPEEKGVDPRLAPLMNFRAKKT